MKVKTDETKIVLTDIPVVTWMFGIVFSSIGLMALLGSLFQSGGNRLGGVIFGLVFGFVGYHSGVSAPYQRLTFDRLLKTLSIRKIGLLKNERIVFEAADIETIYCETESDSEDRKSYRICLTLTSGCSMPIGSTFDSKAECETVIKTAKEFFKQFTFRENYQPKYL